jgi:hypothetical protein
MQARRMLGLASCEQMTAAFSLPNIGLTVPTWAWVPGDDDVSPAPGAGGAGAGTPAGRAGAAARGALPGRRAPPAWTASTLLTARTIPSTAAMRYALNMSTSSAHGGGSSSTASESLPRARRFSGAGGGVLDKAARGCLECGAP